MEDVGGKLEEALFEIRRVIAGQEGMLERVLVCLLSGGHLLIEGVPGLAKTLTIKTTAAVLGGKFQRVQFTPDLVPSDLVGTRVYRPDRTEFDTELGPVFCNFLLADEINRAPAKVQSALLEAMQERQVTIGDETFALPRPFLVLATQNPIEQEGTYPLPEAQTDRFLMKVKVDYPAAAEERQILDRALARGGAEVQSVLTMEALTRAQQALDAVHMDDRLKDYCVTLVRATRNPQDAGIKSLVGMIDMAASPRATIALAMAARAHAFLDGRGFVTPQDVKAIAPDVLRHRIHPSYEAEAESLSSDALVQRLLEHVQVP